MSVIDGQRLKNYLEVPCKCALDSRQSGYCGSIIGTETYASQVSHLKALNE